MKRKGGSLGERRDWRRREAVRLRSDAWTLVRIAAHLGCSTATVTELLKEAATPEPGVEIPKEK